MLAKPRHRVVAAALLAFGVVLAMPLAGAFGAGIDAASVPDLKKAGVSPQYGQTWVGEWMKSSGWGGFESDMRSMRDNGVTPVVMWYYWGDSISPNCVKYGCNGKSKSSWDSMARDMTYRAKSIMGSDPFLVVLEPEFNKAGVQHMESFDGYLADQARAIKAIAPNAKIVVGFGYWGGWDIFDRAVAASDYTGFQLLRGSTRDSQSTALNAPSQIIDVSKALKSKFGKDVVMYDLAIATYGGWEWVQEKVIKDVHSRRGEIDAAGVRVLIWRYLYDNHYSSGYFGPAESTWGVKYSWGGSKSGYDDLLTLMRGSSGGTTSSSGSTGSAPSSAPSDAFSGVDGNTWWVQAKVAGSPTKVEVRVNGGSAVALSLQSWGAWARSTHMPTGSSVELRATYGDGTTRSATYTWSSSGPTGGPTSSETGTIISPSTTSPSTPSSPFSGVSGNTWWIQAKADGGPKKVEVRVDGGSAVPLSWKSWGAWATSTHIPSGSSVELRATYGDGSTRSATYTWSSSGPTSDAATSTSGSGGGSGFTADFTCFKSFNWWTQTCVKGSEPLAGVDVRVNDGSWQPLSKQSWGGWAKSFPLAAGSKVEFQARSSTGATVVSQAYRSS